MTSEDTRAVPTSPYDVITGESAQANKIVGLRSELERVPLFQGMSVKNQELVARLVQRAKAEPGDVLVRQGAPGDELFIISEGTARVVSDEAVTGHMGAGEFFGEISLLDGGPRSSSVVAESAMALLTIQKAGFDHLRATVPGLNDDMISILCARLRRRGGESHD